MCYFGVHTRATRRPLHINGIVDDPLSSGDIPASTLLKGHTMKTGRYLGFCVILLAGAGLAAGDTHYVGNGQSIQAAINAADPGDDIEVAPGTYGGGISLMGKAVHLYSSGGPDATILDAAWLDRVVYCDHGEGPDTILEGFTLTHGDPYETAERSGPYEGMYWGGGMYNEGSSPTVTNCVFTYNSSSMSSGGGMWNESANPTVTNCLFIRNHAHALGGDIYNSYSSPTVAHCTFTDTYANWGGSVVNFGGSPAIINCTFTNCEAERGGVMINFSSNPTIAGCLFSGNSAAFLGAVMYNSDSGPTVTNCTFVGNAILAQGEGGGIFYNESSNPAVANCIFWSNSAEPIVGDGGTVVYSLVQGGRPGKGNIDADPLFVGAGDYHLAPGSPCIDAGTNSPAGGLPSTDLDGDPRIVDGNGNGTKIVDMGAYEAPAAHLDQLLTDLIAYVRGLHLDSGITKSLTAKLNVALRAITSSRPNTNASAAGALNAFCKEVEAQRGHKIPPTDADALIGQTQDIIRVLRGG
jgi:parallel beta-helix repeat protein